MLAIEAPSAHTLKEVLTDLSAKSAGDTIARMRSHLDSKMNLAIPLPRIVPGSNHFKYALLILAGYLHKDACEELGIPLKTADSWRQQIRHAAHARYGFRVDYNRVVQDIMDIELAVLAKRPIPSRLLDQ